MIGFLKFSSLVVILINSGVALSILEEDIQNEDTIIIRASPETEKYSRIQRDVPEEYATVADPAPYSKCRSVRGQPGTCVPLKSCFPIMYQHDADGDGFYEGNPGLAEVYRESVGSCYGRSSGRRQRDLLLFPQFFGLRAGEDDLVCCTTNYTELNLPPLRQLEVPFTTYVVGGAEARKGDYPYIVALMYGAKQFCGGTLISAKHVVTAAHCIATMRAPQVAKIRVQIGDHDIYGTSDGTHEVRSVRTLAKHRMYHPQYYYNDVALLTLSKPATLRSGVSSIGLGSANIGNARVAGWGKLYDGGPQSRRLHSAEVPVMSNAECKRRYGGASPGGVTSTMVCAGGSRTDACSGDSGGPLIQNGALVGIVSWGIGCGRYPGVYTRVADYSSWIRKNQS